MSYLLDSSAWLAHLFGEPGVDEVNQLFSDNHNTVSISVLSLPEIYARLNALGRQEQWPTVWGIYAELFTKVIPVDEKIAHQAIILRAASPKRLPTIDGMIALANRRGGYDNISVVVAGNNQDEPLWQYWLWRLQRHFL